MKNVYLTDHVSRTYNDEKSVQAICEAGFDGIDYSMFFMSDNNFSENPLTKTGYEKYLLNLKNIASSFGKTFEQSHAPFPSVKEGNDSYNAKMHETLKRAIEAAGILDAKIIVVHPVQFSNDQMKRNIELYKNLEPYAEEFGVKIALENMWGRRWSGAFGDKIVPNVCSDAEEFNKYFDALESNNFTCCLDLGHCGLVGYDAAEMIKKMGNNRIGALHVHDNDFVRDIHNLPYMNDMNWDSIIKALSEIDYKGNFTFESDEFLIKLPDELLFDGLSLTCKLGEYMILKIEECRNKQ